MLLLFSSLHARAATEPAGAAIYKTHCGRCHDAGAVTRVPPRSALAQLSPASIRKALESGVMREQGSSLTPQQRMDVANWLSSISGSAQPAMAANACPTGQQPQWGHGPGWTGWGAGPDDQRYQADSGLTPDVISRLKLKWAFGVADAKMMRSQPVAYRGRVYLGTESGSVYALDMKTGCTYWSAQVKNVRSGLAIGKAGTKDALFFGDAAGEAHALDLDTGEELWQSKVADHPTGLITGTPAYENGHLYVPLSSYEELAVLSPNYRCCTFRGSVSALDAATGKILWRAYTIEEQPTLQRKTAAGADVFGPSGASIWSSPTVDAEHHTIYVTTGDNYSDPATTTSDAILALDMETGKQLWSKQFTNGDVYNMGCGKPGTGTCKGASGPDFDFGASPILVQLPAGKRCLLLGQKSAMVYAVDPDEKGQLLWKVRAGAGGALGGVQWGPATDGNLFFVAVSDVAFAEGAVKGQVGLDPKTGGGLSAFEVSSGKLVWKAAPPVCAPGRNPCSPAQSGAITAVAGAVFSGSLDGHLRAYASKDGTVLWDFDTEQSFTTVNHVPAAGGSLDVSGPIVANGMLFVNSGYGQFGGKPGNVLLAFGAD